ncbi:HpcH/HpaI aldolase/citrate lyase family protein [Pseudonocardia kongjuensis]|uniref:HpcH/HpaI aldolase/citrate lyase family protein n=1 Tax=Pseudonocardia kongjuensis TaxID=102227 RepID=A0ABP4IQI8_9PSEU
MPHDLRRHLLAQPLYATTALTGSPVAVEALSGTPFAALCLDMEHTTLHPAAVENLVRAADAGRKPVVVRVPDIGSDINRVLDAGAAGIVVPQVESAEQARAVVARARFAPVGRRGLGATRGADYGAGITPDFTARENDRVLLAVQIESVEAVAAADDILAVDGVDAVVIGPGDLSASLGTPMGSDAFWAAVDEVFAAAVRQGVAPGAFCFRDAELGGFVRRGARLLLVGSDIGWLVQGAAAQWAALQEAVAPIAEGVR